MKRGYMPYQLYVGDRLTCPPGQRCIGMRATKRLRMAYNANLEPAKGLKNRLLKDPNGKQVFTRCAECVDAYNKYKKEQEKLENQYAQHNKSSKQAAADKDIDIYPEKPTR